MRCEWLTLVIGVITTCLPVAARGEETPVHYDPVAHQLQGWTIDVDPKLLDAQYQQVAVPAMEALANHLQRVKYIVPPAQLAQLQQLRIWIELDNASLTNMQYHPDRGWLIAHGLDPRLAKHVHIPQAKELLDRQMWAKHPYVVLHELAHAYHDQVLGFDDREVLAAYEQAKRGGRYEDVLLYTGERVRHYGLTDHKEYFAEASESYFGVNDFYPFVRAELKEHDPTMYALMVKIWGSVDGSGRSSPPAADEHGGPSSGLRPPSPRRGEGDAG